MKIKTILGALSFLSLSLCFSMAFADDMPPKPDNCPDIEKIKTTPFYNSISNPKNTWIRKKTYLGVSQIDNFGTKQMWEVLIYNYNTGNNVTWYPNYLEDYPTIKAAADKAREILSKTLAAPGMNYISNQWVCDYTTSDTAHYHVIAKSPITTLKEPA